MKWKPASIEELRRRGLNVERAREPDGMFRADDPATPEVNEAWKVEEPVKPKRRRKKE
jgi:hypothetical protein